MSRKQYNISEPLAVHEQQLHKVMTTGDHNGWEDLATQPLKEPFTYRSQTYNHVSLGRFRTGHRRGQPIDNLVEFHPLLGIKLLTDPDADVGLSTNVSYAPFSLSAPFFPDDGHAPIGQLLRPISFDIYLGDSTVDDAESVLVRNGQLGTPEEYSAMARAAGHSIIAAAEVLQDFTFEQIDEEWYE